MTQIIDSGTEIPENPNETGIPKNTDETGIPKNTNGNMKMEEIIRYVMETPENVNGNILREKLKDFKGSGGDDSVLVSLIDRSITEIRNDSVTNIGPNVFKTCPALTTVEFPNALQIGPNAFRSCPALTTVELPNALQIGPDAFKEISPTAVINIGAAEGEISGAPWGAPEGVTINYNVRPTSE